MPDTISHLKQLRADPKNRRKHNPRNIGMLVDALQKVGAARSIVIDEQGEVLAGNGVVEAAAEAGLTRVQVVEADGSTIVAVRRTGLTDQQKRELAIYDNRVAELAEWDPEQLQADVADGLTLEPWFSEKEQAALLGASPNGGGNGETEELSSQFLIVITCQSEQQQVTLLERFNVEGLTCKALVS